MIPKLRPYQTDLVERTRQSLRSGKKAPLLVSPCGSGKTQIFSYLSACAAAKGNRVLILAHREELLQQIGETLEKFQVAHGFIAAGRVFDQQPLVQVASVFSVKRRLGKILPPVLIIIDEAHHGIAGSWFQVIHAFPKARVIGVTASPIRLSGEPLKDIFDDMVIGPKVRWLINEGYLSRYKLFAPPINREGLASRLGDFTNEAMTELMDKPTITGDAIREYEKHAPGKRAVVFCVSIEHAKRVAQDFRQKGYRATSIDGNVQKEERHAIIAAFRSGKIQVLTNCGIVSEGFDVPDIECAIILRPTKSLGLWIQMSGRALRPLVGKKYAIILDHAGNVMEHGLPDEDWAWSLTFKKKKTSVRQCPVCFATNYSTVKCCPECGFVFPTESSNENDGQGRVINEVEGELQEIDPHTFRRQRKEEQKNAQTLEQLVALGKSRGYKSAARWAAHVFAARNQKK